eukprot:TRINITY_DN2819_c0_g1_i1.p1 TRINITY_DN2819_c0_g1~~TRINITY_DN2819_c0_g1_i1.p1  ORF type:complete len:544 (-),score=179.60 TRINITY_DN2819_c0_g1_i1:15-1646(-)
MKKSLFFTTLICFLSFFLLQVVQSKSHANFKEKSVKMEVNGHSSNGNGFYKVKSGQSLMEISTRPWLYYLSHKYNSNITQLSDIPIDEFKAFKDRGIEWVWMMGLWELGNYGLHHDRTDPGLLSDYKQNLPDYTLDDVIGSPYAVTQYHCNPQLGTDDDVKALKQKLNSIGLLLMTDFVPNHSAVDCPWAKTNVDYFIRAPPNTQPDPAKYYKNGIAYGGMGGSGGYTWTDTLQLNYWNPNLMKARTAELMRVASLSDGIRCDMAFLILNEQIETNWGPQLSAWNIKKPNVEWWSQAIQTVKSQHPNTVFMAEVYSPWEDKLQAAGFDYTYDKTLYDRLGDGNLDGIRGWLTSHNENWFRHSAHFTSNHDERRAASFFGSTWRANAAAFLTYTLPGMRFYWMWEERGYANKLDVHLRREKSEATNSESVSFYHKLWNITNNDVFNKGDWTYLNVQADNSNTAWRLVAYRWQYKNQKRLVIVNYSDTQGSGTIVVSNAQGSNGGDSLTITDLVSGATYPRSASEMKTKGLQVVVNSWWAQIFEY